MNDFVDAGGALGHAADVESEARRRSGWYARYLGVFAAGQLVLVPIALLWRGLLGALVFSLTNLVLIAGLSVYAARQRSVRRGFAARHGLVLGTWAVAFAVAIGWGISAFEGSVTYALVAAIWCAIPPAVAGWWERERSL